MSRANPRRVTYALCLLGALAVPVQCESDSHGGDPVCETAADCLDAACDGVNGCEHGQESSCEDGFDNDGDGAADCADIDCEADPACSSEGELICDDGLDNDGDGQTDCHDPDCGFTANEARITYYQGIDGGNCGFGTIPTTSVLHRPSSPCM